MSKANNKYTERYLGGIPVNGLLEAEESFLTSNWEEGAKLWRCTTDRTDIVEYLEQFGIPSLPYAKTTSWDVKRPWEYPYLILVTPIANQLFESLNIHQATNGGWTWVRPAEKITSTWEYEFRNGR